MKKVFFTVVGLLILVLIPTLFLMPQDSFNEPSKNPLSLKEALGQTLFIGFEGKEMSKDLKTRIKKFQPGGILLLKRNIEGKEQTKKLISSLQEISRIPLFIAVDQEGGLISPVWWGENTSQTQLNNQIEALRVGKVRAQNLQTLGFNMNLSPVLDSSDSQDYLFSRSFKKNPLLSALFAFNLISGHEQEGVLSVPKHYPGYDTISFNPETSIIPHVKEFPEAETFSNLFFYVTSPILMLSHVVYEDTDQDNPLPLSFLGIKKVKERVGDEVLLMSDDLLSIAFVKEYSLDELGAKALFSGVNILLVAGYPDDTILDEFYNGLWKEAKKDPVLAERIYNSAKKILELKLAEFEDE